MKTTDYREGLLLEIHTTDKEGKELKNSKGENYRRLQILFDDQQDFKYINCFDNSIELEKEKEYNFQVTKENNWENITGADRINEGNTQSKLADQAKSLKEQKDGPQYPQPQLYIKLGDKMYVTQAGLLNEAHKKKLKSITTELIEFKDKEIAIVKSTATTEDGKTFTGYGDATKENTNSMVQKALLRMAETRATNRCLRLLTNIGMTSIEELDRDGDSKESQ